MSTKKRDDDNVRGPEEKRRKPGDARRPGEWTKEEMDEAEPYPLPEIDDEDEGDDKKKKKDR
jgi:hypothetical protein